MKKSFTKKNVVVLLIILLLAGLIFGISYSQRIKKDDKSNTSDSTDTTQQENKISDTANPEDFQLFESKSGDYSFNYPKDWEVVTELETDITTAFVAPKGTQVPNIHVWFASPTISQCNKTTEKITELTVSGIPAKQFTTKDAPKQIITCVENNDSVYHIVHSYEDEQFPQIYAEALKSFKFK